VDEAAITAAVPSDLALLRAQAKARSVAACAGGRDWLVIAADQVVHVDGVALGKPADPRDQLRMLRLLRGRWHQLVTAVALLRVQPAGPRREQSFREHSRLRMRADLEDAELQAYVASGEAASCGGGYMVERKGIQLFEDIEGCWTNVVGLPLPGLIGRLRALGWRPVLGPSSFTEERRG